MFSSSEREVDYTTRANTIVILEQVKYSRNLDCSISNVDRGKDLEESVRKLMGREETLQETND
jgi:hypothetical protein